MLLPKALAGWTAEKLETTSITRGVQCPSRLAATPTPRASVECRSPAIAIVTQFGAVAGPAIASALGKPVMIGSQRAMQDAQGEVIW